METLLQELKKFVSSWGWTYAVIWKIGPDHRTPVWLVSYFNEREEREIGQAQLFENIYRRCQFTPVRPGYACLAWLRQSPYWWSRQLMEPVPTDQNKEFFLTHAKIQTLVCFPGRESANGSGYCVELASTSEVSESEYLKGEIRDFISTSIAPHISSSQLSLLQEVPALTTSMSPSAQVLAAVARQQDADILSDINIQASLHGDDEAIAGFGNIVGREELYYPWTMSSSSHYVSAGLSPSNYPIENFGDYDYQNLGISTFNYGGSSQILGFPELVQGVSTAGGQTVGPNPDWTPIPSGTASTPSSRKGKEILVQESSHKESALTPPPTSQNLSLLQQECLDKLRSPPEPLQQPPSLGPPAKDSSQMIVPPPRYRIPSSSSSAGLRPTGGQVPPGHSPRSLFQPHRHAHFPRVGASLKRPLIYKWATDVAPQIERVRGGLQEPGSSGAERLGSLDGGPATLMFDPRSPNSLAHDQLAAETHKIAERKRRSKMNNKLRTLISIVPIIDKKDKVSVLTSTIEYIRQLTSRISNFEGVERAAAMPATTSRMEEEATMSTSREEELALFSNTDSAGAGPSSSSSAGTPVVKMEVSPDGDIWLIKVQAYNHSRSLTQLLNVFQELGLEVNTLDYGTMNGRFRANVSIKNPRNSSTNGSELQATICRVLETVESSTTGSD